MHGAGGAGASNQVPDLVEDVGHQCSLIARALIESQREYLLTINSVELRVCNLEEVVLYYFTKLLMEWLGFLRIDVISLVKVCYYQSFEFVACFIGYIVFDSHACSLSILGSILHRNLH
jgi:hypothetical protein